MYHTINFDGVLVAIDGSRNMGGIREQLKFFHHLGISKAVGLAIDLPYYDGWQSWLNENGEVSRTSADDLRALLSFYDFDGDNTPILTAPSDEFMALPGSNFNKQTLADTFSSWFHPFIPPPVFLVINSEEVSLNTF